MSALVEQHVSDWQGWPDDVRDRLRAWNAAFLLSFRQGPDFHCDGCGRQIKSHPNGNAVLRPRRKAHGVLRCEDCVITLATTCDLPPDERPVPASRRLEERLRAGIAALEKRAGRLREQRMVDQLYIDRLEQEIPPIRLAALHDELRGRNRRTA